MTQFQTPAESPASGVSDGSLEAAAFWRALTLSDFAAAQDVLRKVTPITPGAFVFPEEGDDVEDEAKAKGASISALVSPLYVAMKSTSSQMSLFYAEADQFCMAPISKRKGFVYKLCGSRSTGVGACTILSHVRQRDSRFKVGQAVLGIAVPQAPKKTDRVAIFSEVLAQPLPPFLRPAASGKPDERFAELMGYRAPYGVWSAMLAHFPTKKEFEEFAAASLPVKGARELRIDTQAVMAPVAAAGALPSTLASGGVGSTVDPALRRMMEGLVDQLRTELLLDLAKVQREQEAHSDSLDDGALGMAALQQELANLRGQNQALRTGVVPAPTSGVSDFRMQALEFDVTGLTSQFEAEKKDTAEWRRDLDGPGGTITGLEEAIEKGVKRSRDDVITLGGESFAGAPDAGALVSTWKPEAWGCVMSFHILLSLSSNPNVDYAGVMQIEKVRASAGFTTVLGSKVYAALQTKYPEILKGAGASMILKEYSAYVGPQQTGIKFEVERGMERVVKQVRSRIKFFFADGSTGKAVCDDALITSVSHVNDFLTFVDNFYEELHTAGVRKPEAWAVVRRCVEKVFDEIESAHASGRDTREASAMVWAIFSGHRVVGLMAKDKYINSPSLTSIMVRTVLENQGAQDREGGASVARELETRTTQTKATVTILKQDVGQLKVDGTKLRDRLRKLEEKE
jgi:hypothetical protein